MPRNMSFFITTEQVKNRTKDITRRLGWAFLKAGDIVNACEKCQGLKKGEKINKLCRIRIISNHPEPLNAIDEDDCRREGFPELSPEQFVEMFCREMKCSPEQIVNRIEFEYLEEYICGRCQMPFVDYGDDYWVECPYCQCQEGHAIKK